MSYIWLCLLRLDHLWQMKKNVKNLSKNVEVAHCWHNMYSIISTYLFIPACYFYDLSERGQYNKEEPNQSLTWKVKILIPILFIYWSVCAKNKQNES